MRKQKTAASFHCTFCNKVVPTANHIEVCPHCGGQLHTNGEKHVCATCGRVMSTVKPEMVSSDIGTEGQDLESYSVDPILD